MPLTPGTRVSFQAVKGSHNTPTTVHGTVLPQRLPHNPSRMWTRVEIDAPADPDTPVPRPVVELVDHDDPGRIVEVLTSSLTLAAGLGGAEHFERVVSDHVVMPSGDIWEGNKS